MPRIYLSPSLQEGNPTVLGISEEELMNRVADAMEPYLRSNGIEFTRNRPDMTLSQVIVESNQGNYDLHLALHSNASPESLAGRLRGTDVYYYEPSAAGRQAATVLANHFKEIYPDPSLVKAVPTTSLAEVSRTRAPAVLMELAYHDNLEDAQWLADNIDAIARNIVQGLDIYFGLPFVDASAPRMGTVATDRGSLNIRSRPDLTASILTSAPKGAPITILGQWRDWYIVNYNGVDGYAASRYIQV